MAVSSLVFSSNGDPPSPSLLAGWVYSTILLELNREGIAGVCGVCGEIGFPGEEAVEVDVPATMGGTPESCLLDEFEERCSSREDDIESDRAAFESRIR
jgi:hypothetical protein